MTANNYRSRPGGGQLCMELAPYSVDFGFYGHQSHFVTGQKEDYIRKKLSREILVQQQQNLSYTKDVAKRLQLNTPIAPKPAVKVPQQQKNLSYRFTKDGTCLELASSQIAGAPITVVPIALASESAPRLSPRTIEKPHTRSAQKPATPQETSKSRYRVPVRWGLQKFPPWTK